jgi:hypothetical protein
VSESWFCGCWCIPRVFISMGIADVVLMQSNENMCESESWFRGCPGVYTTCMDQYYVVDVVLT